MRGRIEKQGDLFYSFQPEDLVPANHPLREIKRLADSELERLRTTFDAAYSRVGRPSIPPES